MIKSFQHKGLEQFFRMGSKAGIQAVHTPRLRLILSALDFVTKPEDMNAPGWKLHQLKGKQAGFWSVTVSGNWRVIFRFDGTDTELVGYVDYH